MRYLPVLAAIALLAIGAAHAEPKMCPHLVSPVCALKDATRTTFNNGCEAEVAGASILHDGACEGGDMCSMLYKPVCAVDPKTKQEKTYSSLCVSEHENARVMRDGECKAP